MSQPYLGEIRMFPATFAPAGWALCNGQLLAISENDALFSLIGTTYGGDGQSTFGLPDLRGRAPVHQGSGYFMGQQGGVQAVTLTINQLPAHTHTPQAANGAPGDPGNSPANSFWSGWTGGQFTVSPPTHALNPAAVGNTGNSQAHENMVPFQAINYIISLFGIYPTQ